VISEVSNTFGDRHSYLCAHDDHRPITREDTLSAQQDLSRLPVSADRGGLHLPLRHPRGPDRRLDRLRHRERRALRHAHRQARAADTPAILRASLRRPFGARRVFALIHWQALKLWWKGAPYRARPEPPGHEVS
jgi:DUF1365 family protein